LGVGTWPRAERGRRVGAAGVSGRGSGTGVGVFEDFVGGRVATGGVGAFGATDSRLGLVEAAVGAETETEAGGVGALTGTGDCGACATAGDSSGGTGDVVMGVSSGLASFETALLTFGVLGPAGASGTCTVFPFVDGFAGSGTGTGVLTLGEGTTEAVRSRGVDTVELGVGIGEATELGAGAMSCRRARLGSGGLDALS